MLFPNPDFMLHFIFFRIFFFLFFLQVCTLAGGQHLQTGTTGVLFYNVENLFNPDRNEGKNDLEFTPDGERRWTKARQRKKEQNISRVILYAGKWNPPVLVGLCEVEDLSVLKGLIFNTGLNHLHYSVVHFESPDSRGIDVALLYRSDRFAVLTSIPIEVDFGNTERATRDILYVKGVLDGKDTLHVMVNHWPSRWGGQVVTAKKRLLASNVLKNLCDSIVESNDLANIIVMGDFNDGPADRSIRNLETCLHNLAVNAVGEVPGTLRYRNEWDCFDQILVSESLLPGKCQNKLCLSQNHMKIITAPFLLEEDPQYPGMRLKRTYRGYQYLGGFSDHLPVYTELVRDDSF